MGNEHLDLLFDLLASPLGVAGIVAIFLIVMAPLSRRRFWTVVALAGFAASLDRPPAHQSPPPLVFPIEHLVQFGRPITIALLFTLAILALRIPTTWRRASVPPALAALVLVQLVIFAKTISFGSVAFAFYSAATFGLVVTICLLISARWLQTDVDFDHAARAIGMVNVFFLVVNAYQLSRDPVAVTFVNSWFHGTTGNPNSASLLLVTSLPALLFLVEKRGSNGMRAAWLVVLAASCVAIFYTGSRTGVAMAIVAALLFYRRRPLRLIPAAMATAMLIITLLPMIRDGSSAGVRSYDAATTKFLSGGDTRTEVWRNLWETFLAHPWAGAPLEADRMGFGESSWLAAAATLGLFGLVPLTLFGIRAVALLFRLDALSVGIPQYASHCGLVIAGIGSGLVGSVAEAFLLGTVTFPLIALLLYLSLGAYLLEVEEVGIRGSTASARHPLRVRNAVSTRSPGGFQPA